ncbi:NACHT domain-containing protein [Pseudomonas sp. s4]|uniref:NACHT domain-containing protein n=1 Tax=Pseudomonas sp. s4 TaxID=353218 RepID=UPI00398C9AAB
MPVELTTASAVKVITPAIASVIKHCSGLLKEKINKWSAAACEKKLTKAMTNINTVKTIWSREKSINLKSFYYPSKVIIDEEVKKIDSAADLPEGHLIIEGIVGQGKSIFLRHLCNSILESNSIPIFIEFRTISSTRTLNDLILSYLDTIGIKGSQEIFEHLANEGLITLVLDGFDELHEDYTNDTLHAISKIIAKTEKLRIIISSRPQHSIQNLIDFEILRLSHLSADDYDPFLRKLVRNVVRRNEIIQAISDAPSNIQGVINTPLMLTLVLSVYDSEKEIPSSLPEFFEKLFNIVFTRHDKLKAGFNRQHFSGLPEKRLQKLFDVFCFLCIQNSLGRSLTDNEFSTMFEKAISTTPDCLCELDGFKKDIVSVACLMLEDGFDLTTFLHKSIPEYHAASFIKHSGDEFAKKFYRRAHEKLETWQSTFGFLANIDSYRYARDYILQVIPQELSLLRPILSSKDKVELGKYLLGLYPELHAGVEGGHVNVWGFLTPTRVHEFAHMLHDNFIPHFSDQIRKSDKKLINLAITRTPQDVVELSQTTKLIRIDIVSELFENDSAWQAFHKFEYTLTTILEKHQTIIDSELGKINILE